MSLFSSDLHFSRLVLGQTDRVDLARVALEIARDEYPDLSIEAWIGRLDGMGVRVRERLRPGQAPELKIREINRFLFQEQGFRGNEGEYYDPRNSFLNQVIERRLGIPITLSLVYLAVAERAGMKLHGVGMPAHFIIKFHEAGQEFFIDPFHGGEFLTRDACEQRVSKVIGVPVELAPDQLDPSPIDQVVLRLLGNLKQIYLRQEDSVRSLRVQERICAISRSDPAELRDLGILCLQNARPGRAAELLDDYLRMHPAAEDQDLVGSLIKTARRRQASMN